MPQIVLALDTPTAAEALRLVDRLGDTADFYKVGLQLYTQSGPSIVSELRTRRKRVFLDLKLHDIPNTVAGAVAAAGDLGVDLLTVHVAGGRAMLEAARSVAAVHLKLLGVTVLTSLDGGDLREAWGRGAIDSVTDEVGRLAGQAKDAGMHGVVASVAEVPRLRAKLGPGFLLVVPGIRLAGADRGDQKRVATPAEAVKAGADYLVVGRAVTGAVRPEAALEAVLAEVSRTEADPS